MKKDIKINYKPYDWQRIVHDTLKTYNITFFHIIKSKRQCGKSIMLEMILLKTALEKKNTESFAVFPTQD